MDEAKKIKKLKQAEQERAEPEGLYYPTPLFGLKGMVIFYLLLLTAVFVLGLYLGNQGICGF